VDNFFILKLFFKIKNYKKIFNRKI